MTVSKEQLEQDFLVILKNSDKNSRLAWARKQKKMADVIKKVQPIEDKLLELLAEKKVIEDKILESLEVKKPLMDEVDKLRQIMIKDCPHLEEFLIHHGKHIECKFCNTNISINRRLGQW